MYEFRARDDLSEKLVLMVGHKSYVDDAITRWVAKYKQQRGSVFVRPRIVTIEGDVRKTVLLYVRNYLKDLSRKVCAPLDVIPVSYDSCSISHRTNDWIEIATLLQVVRDILAGTTAGVRRDMM